MIQRIIAVPSSHLQSRGNRPTFEGHIKSIKVAEGIKNISQITLIDDVVTKGSTAYGCFLRVQELYPDSTIQLFSVFRTQGLIENIEKLYDPDTGIIEIKNDQISRDP